MTPEPLAYFDLIVPCGIDGVEMTAVAREAPAGRAADVTVASVSDAVTDTLARGFELIPHAVAVDDLASRIGVPVPRPAS